MKILSALLAIILAVPVCVLSEQETEIFTNIDIVANVQETAEDVPADISLYAAPNTELLQADLDALTYEVLLNNGFGDTADKLTTSLNLISKGSNGSNISWESSNQYLITNSGRVIRPRWDRPSEEVIMTANASVGNLSGAKEFKFTVLADEEPKEPATATYDGIYKEYMSDEEFFGKWNGKQWTTVGKFDYSKAGISQIEAASKAGNYSLAKEELLNYLRNALPTQKGSKGNGVADSYISGVFSYGDNYQGTLTADTAEYSRSYVNLKASKINKGAKNTYSVMAQYNEVSELYIASCQNEGMRPKVELTVNGQVRTYEAEADTTIRAGNYKNTANGLEQDLKVKMFGTFLGDETYKAMIKFNFGDLTATDSVTAAKLILYAKIAPISATAKNAFVMNEPESNWTEETANFNTFIGYIHNYNGIPGGYDWNQPANTTTEFLYTVDRFFWLSDAVINDYNATKDEKYAYYAINVIMDFIYDKGYTMDNPGYGWGLRKTGRGQYDRSLDSSQRLSSWPGTLEAVIRSRYMTPDICTAIMKQIWDHSDAQTYASFGQNWDLISWNNLLGAAIRFPEFAASLQWIDFTRTRLEKSLIGVYFDDGSYKEKTGHYNRVAYDSSTSVKERLFNVGLPVSSSYDNILHKGAYYNLMMLGPNGEPLSFGDESPASMNKKFGQWYTKPVEWYEDKELEYIDSFGEKGTKPDWTSTQFLDSRMTIMRSDWTKNALYMFTHVRGGGNHGHADDNGVIAFAHDRQFLVDAGRFAYENTDPNRQFATSTKAHNTVEVNNSSQTSLWTESLELRGDIHDWVTNGVYDFLSQTSKTYNSIGVSHQRTIMFVKPYFWIVSDLMTPTNQNTTNSYKQLWHMKPDADLQINSGKKTIASNYASGANIIVASVDNDVTAQEAMGVYDLFDNAPAAAKYAYYQKNNVVGKATFDTVLLPSKSGKPSIDVQRINLGEGVSPSAATAIKFNTDVTGEKNTTYYLLDYEHNPANLRAFDKYKTNAQMTLIREDNLNNIKEIILKNGSEVVALNGIKLVSSSESLKDFVCEIKGDQLNIEMSETDKAGKVKIYTEAALKSVALNGTTVAYIKAGNEVSFTDSSVTIPPINDNSGSKGGVSVKSGGGSSGGITIPNGNTTDNPAAETPNPSNDMPFTDISEHWGKDYVMSLWKKGIVIGSDDRFYPDNHITRAELLTMVARAVGIKELPYEDGFADVHAKDGYSGVVQAGLYAGLISADNVFRPNDEISREEMSKIISIALEMLKDTTDMPSDYTPYYADEKLISGWAREYVKLMSYYKLIRGYEDGGFRPLGYTTRAEAATVVSRLLE